MEGPGIPAQFAPFVVPIDSIRPAERNPNLGDIENLRAMLREFGQRVLLTVRDADGDQLPEITKGNTTWHAAVAEGWTEIAAVGFDDDEHQARAWMLGDNHARDLARTDHPLLDEMLAELARSPRPDLVTSTGYDLDSVLDAFRDAAPLAPATAAGDFRPFPHEDRVRPAAHAGTDLDDPPSRPGPVLPPEAEARPEPFATAPAPPPDPSDPGPSDPVSDPSAVTVDGNPLDRDVQWDDALERFGDKADREVKYPEQGKADPARGDEGLLVVFTVGDLRCKLTRRAYEELLDKYLRVTGNIGEAGRAMAVDLGVDPDAVQLYARL